MKVKFREHRGYLHLQKLVMEVTGEDTVIEEQHTLHGYSKETWNFYFVKVVENKTFTREAWAKYPQIVKNELVGFEFKVNKSHVEEIYPPMVGIKILTAEELKQSIYS